MSQLLIEHKAIPGVSNSKGLTPLHLCSQEKIAIILIQKGSEIDPKTAEGYTPLHIASHFGHIYMVKFLLQHGCQINNQSHIG